MTDQRTAAVAFQLAPVIGGGFWWSS